MSFSKVTGLKDDYARLQLFKCCLCAEGELIESRNRLQGARHRATFKNDLHQLDRVIAMYQQDPMKYFLTRFSIHLGQCFHLDLKGLHREYQLKVFQKQLLGWFFLYWWWGVTTGQSASE